MRQPNKTGFQPDSKKGQAKLNEKKSKLQRKFFSSKPKTDFTVFFPLYAVFRFLVRCKISVLLYFNSVINFLRFFLILIRR
jgi:hypothetical protein